MLRNVLSLSLEGTSNLRGGGYPGSPTDAPSTYSCGTAPDFHRLPLFTPQASGPAGSTALDSVVEQSYIAMRKITKPVMKKGRPIAASKPGTNQVRKAVPMRARSGFCGS
jgi:hypothetical protein